jgi:hypothetical protein
MNRNEFKALRNLPDKRISADIRFELKQPTSPNLTFEDVVVENSLNYEVVLNGTFKPDIPSVTFNFVLRGTGPICRLCVNGTIHPGAGRTHKHDLRQDSDPRNNLPAAVPRPELDGRNAKQIWETLLQQANIEHTGTFHDPEQAP